MPRPSDWSALGLDGDPTPGDAARIDEVISSQENLVSLADTIDEGLTSVLNTTDGVFVGETADALRDKIDGDLRKYVSTFRQAHKDVQNALRTYVDVMRTQQKRADDALTAAAALQEDDDAGREEQKAIAEDAKSELKTAASTASDAIREAAYSIASPIDECEEFWKALGWLALILVIPAMIVGGPLALFAIGLNVALLIKTAIDFSQGKASITDLVLSIIGVIAPTTKGIRLGDLWKGLKGLGAGAFKGAGNLFSGANSLGSLTRLTLGFDDVFAASGNWLRGLQGLNGLKISGAGLHFMPGAKGFTMGINGIHDIRLVPAVSGLTVINLAGAKTFFAMKTVIGGLAGIRALGTTALNTTVNGLRGANSLRLLLPVAADELGHGVLFALRIGVIDRGVFGLYRYGAFAGGQFIGATSKISGAAAHGLQLAPPAGGFGSLAHVNLSGVTPAPPAGATGGFTTVHGLGGGTPLGGIDTSSFHGLGSTINASVPGIGAKVVDVPSVSGLSGVNAVHIPTLGPVNAVSPSGIGVPHIAGGVTDVGQVTAHGVDVPHLGAQAGGRVDTPALGGLGQVHTPQLGSVAVPAPAQGHVAAPGQVTAPGAHQVNVPSLGSVAQGSVVGKLDAPPVGARVSDLPSVGAGAARVDVPATGHLSLPSLARGTETAMPSVGRVDIAAVGRGTEIGVPAVGRVDLPSTSGAGALTTPPVGRVDVPAAGATAAPPVSAVDVPAVRPADAGTPSVAQPHLPAAYQPGQAQAPAPAASAHVATVPGGAQGTVAPLPAGAAPGTGEGGGLGGLGQLNGSVTGIDPKPTPTPATTGGLAGPGSGSLVADLGRMGLIDLSVLAQRTIAVNMVHAVRYDLQHTFRELDELLPGVVVDVRPGTGAARAHVTVTHTGGLSGVTAYHLQHEGRDILRIERTLDDGTVHRWGYYLEAANDYAPTGPMEVVPAAARGGGGIELTSLPGGSHRPAAGSSAAVAPAPVAPPLTFDVPGVNHVQLRLTRDGAGGIGQATVTVPPGGGAWTATVRPGHAPGTPGTVHLEHPVSDVEVRHMDLSPLEDGNLRVLSDERFVTLSGGPFDGATVALDSLDPAAVRHVPRTGAPAPADRPGMLGNEVRMPTGDGFLLYNPVTGRQTRSGLRLADGAGGEIHVLPSADGRLLGLTAADGTPVPAPHARITPQTGGGFRVEYGASHVVVDATGRQTHTVVPLGGSNDFVLTSGLDGSHTLADAQGTAQARLVTVQGADFRVPDAARPYLTHVYDAQGVARHDLLAVRHGDFADRPIRLPLDGAPPSMPGANVVPQGGGGYRVHDTVTGRHVVVGPDGVHTHDVVPLGATDEFVVHPPGRLNEAARVGPGGEARGPVTVQGADFHVPDAAHPHLTHVYDAHGAPSHDLLALHGHAHIGGSLRINPADGTPTLDGGGAVRQGGGGFRVEAGGHHAVFDAHGAHTHDVVPLSNGQQFVHLPVGGGAPRLMDAAGTPVQGAAVVVRADGHLVVTSAGGRALHLPDGTLHTHVGHLLGNGQGVRVHPGGYLELRDADMNVVDDVTVTARPGGGHRLTGADGEVRLFGPAGAHDRTLTPAAAGGHTFHVTQHGGAEFDVVQLSDGIGSRFVRTDTHALLDGDLDPVPAGPHTLTHQVDGNYRLTFTGGGGRNQEYHLYDPQGRLFEQRINVFDEGTLKGDQFLKVTHPLDGVTKPSWERVRLDGAGQPVAAPAVRAWYDAGTVDTKGLGNGRISLTTHSGVGLMERRPLPNGHVLDGYHSTAGVGSFGRFHQRGGWTEFDATGAVVGSGTRHWGESGRSWFDVTGSTGSRVRHYQELPDGGHVLADLGRHPLTQSFGGDTRWTRFDSDFNKVAEGDRTWGPGRGFTDRLPHPKTGVTVVAQEKSGRFTWSVDDVRRLHQTEFGADGMPKKDYTSWSPHGKENGRGVTLKDGGFLDSTRFAEQRPPRAFRWIMSPEYRATRLDGVPWLARDSRLQMHTWTETAPDGSVTHGVRFVSNNGTVTDINRAGDIVRETRKPLSGKTVTTGDVALPDGVAKQNGYLPWKQGDDGPKGHRTYRAADFDTAHLPPGVNAADIRWQERFMENAPGADWYTPNAGGQWHVARMGLADGTVVDFRPPPGAAGREGRMGPTSDWTRYDHHGLVVARQDTFPDPAGGANPLRVTSQNMLDGTVRWNDGATSGIRRLNHHRGEVTPWGWDRESFQDFDATGALLRDHRLLADGTVVDAWKNPGTHTWHWNKTGADGEIKGFGNNVGDRVRQWFDGSGNPLPDFRPGAVFRDVDNGAGGQVVQEIPARPAGTPRFQDSPYRVREYLQTPGAAHDPHVWKEYDNGIELGRKTSLPDGSYLESEDWHKQWRRFGQNGTSLIDERTVPGYVWHRDTFGRTSLIGRETNFTGVLSEYRGFNRMWREPNRWEWGHTAGGVSTYTSFPYKAGQALAVDLLQDLLLDFGLNLTVYGIVAAATGTSFGWNEVGKAAFGAAVGAGVKGTFSLGHYATFRGGPWKTGLSQVDQGNPYARRPNDDSWTAEFAGNEKVTRWRSGTYDWGVGLVSGALSGFITGAASSAIFGVKDADGNIVHLHGTDALVAGAVGMAGGVAGAVSLGAARTAMIQNFGGRFYHRGGLFDTFAIAGLGKLVDKTFANLYLTSALQKQVFPGHDFYAGEQGNEQNGGSQ